jgi:hypothetical protein
MNSKILDFFVSKENMQFIIANVQKLIHVDFWTSANIHCLLFVFVCSKQERRASSRNWEALRVRNSENKENEEN